MSRLPSSLVRGACARRRADGGDLGLPELVDHDPVVAVVGFEHHALSRSGLHIADGLVFSDDLAHGHKRVGSGEHRSDLAGMYTGGLGVFRAGCPLRRFTPITRHRA